MEKYKYQITVITKTWVDPENPDAGVNVSMWHDYAVTKQEAEVIAARTMRSAPEGAVSVMAFYVKITMVEQVPEVESS